MATPAHRRATTSVVGQVTRAGQKSTVAVTEEIVPYPFEIIRPSDIQRPDAVARVLLRMQEHARDSTVSARSLPCLGGVYFPSVKMVTGQTIALAHGLGVEVTFLYADMRLPGGGWPMPPYEVAQDAALNRLFVKAWVTMTVDFWVFPRPKAVNKDPILGRINDYTPPTPAPVPAVGWMLPPGSTINSNTTISLSLYPFVWILFTGASGGYTINLQNALPQQQFLLTHVSPNRVETQGATIWGPTISAGSASWTIENPGDRSLALAAGQLLQVSYITYRGCLDGTNNVFRWIGAA